MLGDILVDHAMAARRTINQRRLHHRLRVALIALIATDAAG
jgi:hypothetical protein